MTIKEKAAYLKGLMDGCSLDVEKPEGKMISAIVDLLGDIAKRVTDIEETTIAISDELDEIEEDLDAIEDFILDEDDEDDFDDFDNDDDAEEFPTDFEMLCNPDFDEDSIYKVACKCGRVMIFDSINPLTPSTRCDRCGEFLEDTMVVDNEEENNEDNDN